MNYAHFKFENIMYYSEIRFYQQDVWLYAKNVLNLFCGKFNLPQFCYERFFRTVRKKWDFVQNLNLLPSSSVDSSPPIFEGFSMDRQGVVRNNPAKFHFYIIFCIFNQILEYLLNYYFF